MTIPLTRDSLLAAISGHVPPAAPDVPYILIRLVVPPEDAPHALELAALPSTAVLWAVPSDLGGEAAWVYWVDYLPHPDCVDYSDLLAQQPLEVILDSDATEWNLEFYYPTPDQVEQAVNNARRAYLMTPLPSRLL